MHRDTGITVDAGGVLATRLLDYVAKHTTSAQEMRGDQRLDEARALTVEYETVIDPVDRAIIEERITFAREMKSGLESKWGLSKFLQAREYRRVARNAYRFAKTASDRGRDEAYFAQRPDTPMTTEDPLERVASVARSLWRCYISCKDAFPTSKTKDEWVGIVWTKACVKTGLNPGPPMPSEQFADGPMKLLTDMKLMIMHAVEAFYGFDTSQAPDSIGHNTALAHALLADMTFIYGDPNFGGEPHHPYRHPIIQKAINITWFQNKDDNGITFHEYFSPMPVAVIALVLTVIECCIDEWTDGTRRASTWDEERLKTVYQSHRQSLADLGNHAHAQGGELLEHIQSDLLKNARKHAGAMSTPVTESGRFSREALDGANRDDLDAANRDDLPAYLDIPEIIFEDGDES
ncbi:hypothetical protein B0F90DRAFT_1114424 [Multifurca ochricompacta]|uniref:DUF6532 domain-containing protein n=1 Tax=Multifurca ochricompacta TaxID=376703 RepID=A0AAD4QL98_9AGAM|nr:hypothetical protein B0F90DRAFT_1114424 [Multifurca ochricompacta]